MHEYPQKGEYLVKKIVSLRSSALEKNSKILYFNLLTSYIYCLDYVAFDKSDCEVFLLYFF